MTTDPPSGGTVDPNAPEYMPNVEAPFDYLHSDLGINELHAWVLNQQPAHISALADQFEKAYDMLLQLEQAVRDHTTKLFNETWTHSDARDAFMQKGPGTVLTSIKSWQDAALRNETALR